MCVHSREEDLKRVRGNVQITSRTLLQLIGRSKSHGHTRFKEKGNRFHILMGGVEKSYCKGPGYKEDEGLWSFSQCCTKISQMALVVKNPSANAGGRHSNLLQYSCLENPMDSGAWWATVHRVTKSWAWLKRLSTHAHTNYKVTNNGNVPGYSGR